MNSEDLCNDSPEVETSAVKEESAHTTKANGL